MSGYHSGSKKRTERKAKDGIKDKERHDEVESDEGEVVKRVDQLKHAINSEFETEYQSYQDERRNHMEIMKSKGRLPQEKLNAYSRDTIPQIGSTVGAKSNFGKSLHKFDRELDQIHLRFQTTKSAIDITEMGQTQIEEIGKEVSDY